MLNTHWSSAMGGAEYQVSLIINELRKDPQIEIFYLCRNTKSTDKRVISVKSKNRLSKYAYFFDSLKLYKTLKDINPDIVYHRDAGAYTGVCARYCKQYKKQFLWNLAHDKDVTLISWQDLKNPFKFIDKLLLEYGIKNKQTIIAQTIEQQFLLKQNYKIDNSVLIPNFHPYPAESDKKPEKIQVSWVANLKAVKRPELFLELVRHFKDQDQLQFIMVGSVSNEYEEDIFITQSECKNFTFMGSIPQEEVNHIIHSSAVFVNTSLTEGFPNTFIQAWLRETPVISVTVDPSQIIKSEKVGVMANDLEGMIKAIDELLVNPSKFKVMGKNAITYATKNHSLKNIDDIKTLMGLVH